ncbi:MAG: RNA polymerase sigma factor [Anaerolineales bacterium]|jgi:RNA polymerase sigma-70 factor (ECF subfamily)
MCKQSIQISDPADFSLLFEQTHHLVFRYIYSLHGGPQEEVEDLTADTYWRAWRARYKFQGNHSGATGWLLKIAKRLVIDSYRRSKTRGFEMDIEKVIIPITGATPEEKALQKEQIEEMFILIQDLPIEHREMIILRYMFGWRVKDIGTLLDIPENTVSVTLRRAFNKIKNKWDSMDIRDE